MCLGGKGVFVSFNTVSALKDIIFLGHRKGYVPLPFQR